MNKQVQGAMTKSARFLIVLVCLVAVCVLAALNLNTPRIGAEPVDIPDAMRSCTVNSDCISVHTTCDGCCHWAAVNKTHESVYQAHFSEKCTSYQGTVCDCALETLEQYGNVRCVDHQCVQVKPEGSP